MQNWLVSVGIKPIHICPGSPWQNGYNGTLRRKALNNEPGPGRHQSMAQTVQ
jgi:hypothetical protein